jgi:hypothetical protein
MEFTLRASDQLDGEFSLPLLNGSLAGIATAAPDTFGRRPLSRAYRPFIGPMLKGGKGSILFSNGALARANKDVPGSDAAPLRDRRETGRAASG